MVVAVRRRAGASQLAPSVDAVLPQLRLVTRDLTTEGPDDGVGAVAGDNFSREPLDSVEVLVDRLVPAQPQGDDQAPLRQICHAGIYHLTEEGEVRLLK